MKGLKNYFKKKIIFLIKVTSGKTIVIIVI